MRQNRFKHPDDQHHRTVSQLAFWSILAAIVLVLSMYARQHTTASTMPATEVEKQNALHHVIRQVSDEAMRQYNYYNDRSKP